MGTRFDEKKKYWIASYSKRHPVTRQPYSIQRKGLKTKAEALRVEKELVIEIDKKLRSCLIPNWNKAVSEYISSMERSGVSGKSVDTYRLCLQAHTSIWDQKQIDEITGQEIRDLIISKAEAYSPSHQKNILKYIRGAFTYALERGWITSSPVPKMKIKIGDKLKAVLTKEQVSIFLNQAKIMESEWYPIWAMALYTGMRNGELFALSWDKVNLDLRKIKVDSSWNSRDGFKDTKSGDDRMVEIAPELLTILKELKLRSVDSVFVLPRIDKWDKGEQARELRMFLQGLGLPRIRFHDLRATWATIMLTLGIAPIKVMAMGGWKDLKTMQFYIRKAGVDTTGISDLLNLHNPSSEACVLNFK